MSEYDSCDKSKLKLKSDSGIVKKKKKNKKKEKLEVKVDKIIKEENLNQEAKPTEVKRTKAEIAFFKMQEKMQKERIMQKAQMTHKQRVEEFNRHLDSLTEHFDIPKVSWTK